MANTAVWCKTRGMRVVGRDDLVASLRGGLKSLYEQADGAPAGDELFSGDFEVALPDGTTTRGWIDVLTFVTNGLVEGKIAYMADGDGFDSNTGFHLILDLSGGPEERESYETSWEDESDDSNLDEFRFQARLEAHDPTSPHFAGADGQGRE